MTIQIDGLASDTSKETLSVFRRGLIKAATGVKGLSVKPEEVIVALHLDPIRSITEPPDIAISALVFGKVEGGDCLGDLRRALLSVVSGLHPGRVFSIAREMGHGASYSAKS